MVKYTEWPNVESAIAKADQEAREKLKRYSSESSNGDLVIKFTMFGGNCPVQAEGTLNDVDFYFRARGNYWSMSVGGEDVIGKPDWYFDEEYGDQPFAAGYMPEEDAKAFIEKAAKLWLEK